MLHRALVLTILVTIVACAKAHHRTVTATAFNSTRAQTDARPGETACGDRISAGSRIIAVSRDLTDAGLVCGTEIQIKGLDGTWTVSDRMASHHRNKIDIYMGTSIKAAREWGVREVEITWKE
jgi:3D (Asp-Asp-Asp) domain-containing protein